MFKSKRFIALMIAIVLFLVLTYTTDHSLLEISGSVTMLVGVYIGAQAYRGSNQSDRIP